MKIVLDNTILVRANDHSQGLARELLLTILESGHTLLLSNEMLHELARVLRYPRLRALYCLNENLIFDYIDSLRQAAEIVMLDPLLAAPIRDVNDIVVMQTVIIGEAEILCTKDNDFFQEPASAYLRKLGVSLCDDIALMNRLRT